MKGLLTLIGLLILMTASSGHAVSKPDFTVSNLRYSWPKIFKFGCRFMVSSLGALGGNDLKFRFYGNLLKLEAGMRLASTSDEKLIESLVGGKKYVDDDTLKYFADFGPEAWPFAVQPERQEDFRNLALAKMFHIMNLEQLKRATAERWFRNLRISEPTEPSMVIDFEKKVIDRIAAFQLFSEFRKVLPPDGWKSYLARNAIWLNLKLPEIITLENPTHSRLMEMFSQFSVSFFLHIDPSSEKYVAQGLQGAERSAVVALAARSYLFTLELYGIYFKSVFSEGEFSSYLLQGVAKLIPALQTPRNGKALSDQDLITELLLVTTYLEIFFGQNDPKIFDIVLDLLFKTGT